MPDLTFWKGKKILVTGGAGFLGSYVVENLIERRHVDPLQIVIPRKHDCDLRDPKQCLQVAEGCAIILHLAAVTGSIAFSRAYPATQYHDSTLIDLNVLEAARITGVMKVAAIGNLFAYPAKTPVPFTESMLFDGLPAHTHLGVGWMKRNLSLMAQLYHSEHGLPMVVVYSANGYGPRDSTDLMHAHVIPATIMKCLNANEIVVWGDGSPTRDFLFASDIAEGLLLAAEELDAPGFVNIGSKSEISIRKLVELITFLTAFQGKVTWDASKSAGDAGRVASVQKAEQLLGFEPKVDIEEGLQRTIEWYRKRK